MADYRINLDRKVLKLLGSQLYGDVPSVIAELVANSYDADAKNVWISLDTHNNIITIEDDGRGMSEKDINEHFLNIGYEKRDAGATTDLGRKYMGRKGIGKLAVFSLTNYVRVLSTKDGEKAGCILDFDKITLDAGEPQEIPEKEIVFIPQRLSSEGTGTRLELINIKKRLSTSFRFIVNKLIRMFDVNNQDFSIRIRKNNEEYKILHRNELNYFSIMDTIVTIGDEFQDKIELVSKNSILEAYKFCYSYEDFLRLKPRSKLKPFPYKINVENKDGQLVDIDFRISGWIGTVDALPSLKQLNDSILGTGDDSEEEKISISDNRISIFSRKKLGEFDILPKIKVNTNNEAYVIGELFVDIFEDDSLSDMAISNRRGYEEQDARYTEMIKIAKRLLAFVVELKTIVSKRRKEKDNNEEFQKIKTDFFTTRPKTSKIFSEKLSKEEIETFLEENYQFSRAIKLSHNTRKVLISHSSKYKLYGDFIIRIFENLGIDPSTTFIYTSDKRMSAPDGVDVFDYLKECFRENIYVIYILSKYFYDSNPCMLETGAAWATNKSFSNLIVDIGNEDIDYPINSADKTIFIGDIGNIDIVNMVGFIKTVLLSINIALPKDDAIEASVKEAIEEFSAKTNELPAFYPRRKYQAHPVCEVEGCQSAMELECDERGKVIYKCKSPSCSNTKNVSIY